MKVARWEARRFFCVYKGSKASVCTKENNIYSIKCGYKYRTCNIFSMDMEIILRNIHYICVD